MDRDYYYNLYGREIVRRHRQEALERFGREAIYSKV